MAGDYWDGSAGGIGPNLAKLPLDVRENLTRPIPLREGESYGRVVLFRKSPGLVHPNGRVNITTHRPEELDGTNAPVGIQIDALNFNARIPLATFVLAKDAVPGILTNLLRSFIELGASREDIENCITAAYAPPKISLSSVVNFEEQASNE